MAGHHHRAPLAAAAANLAQQLPVAASEMKPRSPMISSLYASRCFCRGSRRVLVARLEQLVDQSCRRAEGGREAFLAGGQAKPDQSRPAYARVVAALERAEERMILTGTLDFGPRGCRLGRGVLERPARPRDHLLTTPARLGLAPARVVGVSSGINPLMLHGPGEPDRVRILNDVLIWEKTGAFPGGEDRPKLSPLYLILVKSPSVSGLDLPYLIKILTVLNTLLGALILVPLSGLWMQLPSADGALAVLLIIERTEVRPGARSGSMSLTWGWL